MRCVKCKEDVRFTGSGALVHMRTGLRMCDVVTGGYQPPIKYAVREES